MSRFRNIMRTENEHQRGRNLFCMRILQIIARESQTRRSTALLRSAGQPTEVSHSVLIVSHTPCLCRKRQIAQVCNASHLHHLLLPEEALLSEPPAENIINLHRVGGCLQEAACPAKEIPFVREQQQLRDKRRRGASTSLPHPCGPASPQKLQ